MDGIKYVKSLELKEEEISKNVNETKKQEKKTVHFAMYNEDNSFDDKNSDLQMDIESAISIVDENVAKSGFGIIDEDYENFPLSQNKPYTVQTEDISEDESPEIKVDTITENEKLKWIRLLVDF